jgi:hypothetical protein
MRPNTSGEQGSEVRSDPSTVPLSKLLGGLSAVQLWALGGSVVTVLSGTFLLGGFMKDLTQHAVPPAVQSAPVVAPAKENADQANGIGGDIVEFMDYRDSLHTYVLDNIDGIVSIRCSGTTLHRFVTALGDAAKRKRSKRDVNVEVALIDMDTADGHAVPLRYLSNFNFDKPSEFQKLSIRSLHLIDSIPQFQVQVRTIDFPITEKIIHFEMANGMERIYVELYHVHNPDEYSKYIVLTPERAPGLFHFYSSKLTSYLKHDP